MNHRNSLSAILVIFFLTTSAFSQNVRFTLLHTSDEHSMMLPSPLVDYSQGKTNSSLGGFARLATKVKEIKRQKAEQDVLLFSSGDIMGGSPFAWLILNREAAELNLMTTLGYNAIAIGNHEFDYGPEVLATYYQLGGDGEGSTSILCSNIKISKNHPLDNAGIEPFKIFELKQGVKIGVFSLLGKNAIKVAPYAKPVLFEDQHQTAKTMIENLKSFGVDIIVAITHSGVEEDVLLAKKVHGINIILGGHHHYTTTEPLNINHTIILHSGQNLEKLGHLEFEYELKTKQLQLRNEIDNLPYHYPINDDIAEDSLFADMVNAYEQKLNAFLRELTDNKFVDIREQIVQTDFPVKHHPMEESPLGNFVTDAMRMIGKEATGERIDLAIQAAGVLRANIGTASKVSFLDLAAVSSLGQGPDGMPGYPLVSVYLTGKEIMNLLEIAALLPQLMGPPYFLQMSGLRLEYDPRRAYWFRIPFNGTPLPAYKAVQEVQMYSGEGVQRGDNFEDIHPIRLYHVVTDHYIGSYLPMIGQELPKLNIVLKNKSGHPIQLKEAIIYRNGKELKIWQVVAEYAASLKTGDNNAQIPVYYQQAGSRLVIVNAGSPLWLNLLMITLVSILILILAVYYVKKSRRKKYQ